MLRIGVTVSKLTNRHLAGWNVFFSLSVGRSSYNFYWVTVAALMAPTTRYLVCTWYQVPQVAVILLQRTAWCWRGFFIIINKDHHQFITVWNRLFVSWNNDEELKPSFLPYEKHQNIGKLRKKANDNVHKQKNAKQNCPDCQDKSYC